MANIIQRGENSYRFVVSLPKNAKGEYPRRTTTYVVTEKLSPKKLEEHLEHEYLKFKQEVLSGNYIKPEKMIFSVFAEEWLKKFAEKELSSTTFANYESKLTTNILPVIGHVRMDEINTLMLQSLMDGLKRKDGSTEELSFYTKFDVYRTLRSIFKYAIQWKVLVKNPLEGVTKPKNRNKKEVSAYDEEEVAVIFKALNDEPFKWRIFAMLAIVAGIRRGENLALEWSDMDFENSRIDIHQSIVSADGKTEIKDTKTDSSNRLVSLPSSVIEELKKYRVHWVQEKLKAKNWTETEHEWLFHQRNGTYAHPSSATHWWNKFAKKLDIKYIRLHDLRHTSASLLIAQGVHAKIISERLGHANIKITMDTYGHALRSADQAAADKFEILFQPKAQEK